MARRETRNLGKREPPTDDQEDRSRAAGRTVVGLMVAALVAAGGYSLSYGGTVVLANAGDVAAIRIEPGEVLWRREVGILHPGGGIPPRPPDGSSFSAAELMRSFRPE